MTQTPPSPVPGDDRDWTFVITEGCPECGFRPFTPDQAARRLAAGAARWAAVLERADVAQRPAPQVWSALEYACHVRDVVRLFGERVAAMRDEDTPVFADWDGDAQAVESAYWSADPSAVARELDWATRETVEVLELVPPADLDHPGRRSDGMVFTIATLGQYFVHEMEHHLHDVGG